MRFGGALRSGSALRFHRLMFNDIFSKAILVVDYFIIGFFKIKNLSKIYFPLM